MLNIRPGENPAIGNADLMSFPTVGVDLDVPVAALSARPDIRASEARLQSAFKTLESDQAQAGIPTHLHRLDARHLILNLKQGL